jgi:nitrite reductase (NADH) small subunit
MNERTFHTVGSLSELRKGKPLGVTIAGRDLAVFEINGEVIATNGKCLHAGGPLCQGEITGTILTCPWHGWSYDLRTGVCEEDVDLILERFQTRIEGDDILVAL